MRLFRVISIFSLDTRLLLASKTHQATVDRLSRGLLHLPQLGDKVPEAGLGHYMVGGEDPHAIQRRIGVLGRGQQTPNHLVFPKLGKNQHTSVRQNQHYRATSTVNAENNLLDLEFTFKGTTASMKGDKIQFSICTPDKIIPIM